MSTLNDNKLYIIANAFDGKMRIRLGDHKNGNYHALILSLNVTHHDVAFLEGVKKIFGGHVKTNNGKRKGTRGVYLVMAAKARKLLQLIYPHLLESREDVNKAFEILQSWRERSLGHDINLYVDAWRDYKDSIESRDLATSIAHTELKAPSDPVEQGPSVNPKSTKSTKSTKSKSESKSGSRPKSVKEVNKVIKDLELEEVEMTIDEFYHKVYKTPETDKYDEQVELFYQAHGRYHATEEELNEWLVANEDSENSEASEDSGNEAISEDDTISEDDNESPDESPNED